MDPLDEVRVTCARVAKRASHVRVNLEGIASYGTHLSQSLTDEPALDPTCHYLNHGEDTASFFITLDAINFGSGYFPHLQKRAGMSGYFTIASYLNDHFASRGPLSAHALKEIVPADCAKIFHQDMRLPETAELMYLFAKALNDLGNYLLDRFRGRFVDMILAAEQSSSRLVEILREMPLFDDTAVYDGATVSFYKRAQLTAADLTLAFGGTSLGKFEDIDRLTIFADNLVPHVLRIDGILAYDSALVTRIERGELIVSGSPEEIEIRACAVHAVGLIVEELTHSGCETSAHQLDYILWNRGQGRHYKDRPRHRTRCAFY